MRTYHRVTFSARIVRPSLLCHFFFCFLYLFALRFHALVGTLSLSLTVTGRRDDGSQHPSPSLGRYYHRVGSLPAENSPADYVRPTDLPTARTRTVTFLKSLVPRGTERPEVREVSERDRANDGREGERERATSHRGGGGEWERPAHTARRDLDVCNSAEGERGRTYGATENGASPR